MFDSIGNVFGHGDCGGSDNDDDDADIIQDDEEERSNNNTNKEVEAVVEEENEYLLEETTTSSLNSINEEEFIEESSESSHQSLRQRRCSSSSKKKKRLSFNAIRTAPFHRRSSWQPKEEGTQKTTHQQRPTTTKDTTTTTTTKTKEVKEEESSSSSTIIIWDILLFKKWHIYDNQGSFNGWFDWLPIWMRVGYWSPIFVCTMIGFYYSLIKYKPTPSLEFFPTTRTTLVDDNQWYWWLGSADWLVCIWGIFVVIHAKLTMGNISGFYISYTGWSWCILTARAGFEALSRLLLQMTTLLLPTSSSSSSETTTTMYYGIIMNNVSHTLAIWGSALKFPAVVAAVITFTIWNFILFPLIYFGSTKNGSKKRKDFLKFNFSFFMSNIHLLNLPLALINTVCGPGARPFTESDLWIALVIAALYSLLYLFFLDRLGLHFYPIFCPRFSLSTISFGLVIYLYWFLMQQGNKAILYFNPSLE